MTQLAQMKIGCPYCGESLSVLIDAQDADEEYIEDCQVCCRPISFLVTHSMSGELSVSVRSEDELF